MANKLPGLTIGIAADVAQLRNDMNKAQREVKRGVGGMVKQANAAKRAFAGIATALIGGFSVNAFRQMLAETSKAIDANAKFADVVGLSTEAFAGYQLAAKITGVELSQLNTGFQRFLKNIGDAGDGLAAPTRALEKIGLTFEDLKDLDTDEQLKLVADRYKSLESSVDRANVALTLFGRSGIAISKLLDTGSDGIGRFRDEAEKLGLAINRVDAAQVEAANDALTRAGGVAEGFKNRLTVQLAPAIEAVANLYTDAAVEADGFSAAAARTGDIPVQALGAVGDAVEEIKIGLIKSKEQFAEFSAFVLTVG